MTTETIEFEWRIGSQQLGDGDAASPHMIKAVRIISDDEREELELASILLSEVSENSPFKTFEDKYAEFNKFVAEVAKNQNNGKGSMTDLKAIPGKLDDLLSALRAFDDRTSNNLSKRYGKNSDQFNGFHAALSYEFDNVFAYRFCCQLRNYSQHAGAPISDYGVTTRLVNGKPVSYCRLMLDSNDLLTRYTKWRADVKVDLQKINGTFSLTPVLAALMKSSARAFNKHLLSQETEVREAMGVVRVFAKDIPDSEWPILVRTKKELQSPEDLKNIAIQPIKRYLADSLETMLQNAHVMIDPK